jgi:hypothetical protein
MNTELIDFKLSLNETLLFCQERFSMFNIQHSLRSKELKPSSEHLIFSNHESELVDQVVQKRHTKVGQKVAASRVHLGEWGYGDWFKSVTLLAYYPSSSLSDGSSPPPTGGFLDDNDCPPWDSWVWFHNDYLIRVVPPEMVSAVQMAIATNSTYCIGWLGYAEDSFAIKVLELIEEAYLVNG